MPRHRWTRHTAAVGCGCCASLTAQCASGARAAPPPLLGSGGCWRAAPGLDTTGQVCQSATVPAQGGGQLAASSAGSAALCKVTSRASATPPGGRYAPSLYFIRVGSCLHGSSTGCRLITLTSPASLGTLLGVSWRLICADLCLTDLALLIGGTCLVSAAAGMRTLQPAALMPDGATL